MWRRGQKPREGDFQLRLQKEPQYKAIFCDFDGTLAGKDLKVSSNDAHWIRKSRIRAVRFSICTGKQWPGVIEAAARDLGLEDPQIVNGGAEIFAPSGALLHREYMPWELASGIVSLLEAYQVATEVPVAGINYANTERFRMGHKQYAAMADLPHADLPKIRVNYDPDEEEKLEAVMLGLGICFPDLSIREAPTPRNLGYDITMVTATKSQAVTWVTHQLGLSKEETLGIGDALNDLPTFEACGYKVAMGNAEDGLKKAADFVAPSLEEGGVATVLQLNLARQLP